MGGKPLQVGHDSPLRQDNKMNSPAVAKCYAPRFFKPT